MICQKVLGQLLSDGSISTRDSVLTVCAGTFERAAFHDAEFTDVTITNLDEQYRDALAPYKWSRQDAENLTYPDKSFDVVFVHGGLHHCYSPHRGLLEMYRVARKAIIVIEARDSLSMKIAQRLRFTEEFEIEPVSCGSTGVANVPIPNFVYRWTENEVLKTVKSFEPRYVPEVRFFYGLRLPYERFRSTPRPALRLLLRVLGPSAELFATVFPKQGNEFAFVIFKGGDLQPWLAQQTNGTIALSQEKVAAMGRVYKRAR